jgi:CDP-archaeol synthase
MKELFIYIVVPLIISNVLHMVIVKKNIFSFLAIPVSTKLFGQNKTWRGFVIVPLLNAFLLLLINLLWPYLPNVRALIIGFLLGIAYMLFELPNSYLKRRLGIAPGGKAADHRWLLMLIDKTDSSFGVSLFSYFLLDISWVQVLQLFLISVLTHILFSYLLVTIRIKKSF